MYETSSEADRPAEVAAGRQADHAERDDRGGHGHVGGQHLPERDPPPSGRHSITIGSEANTSTARCDSAASSLPSTIAVGRKGLARSIS